jgi:hypothetical protein
LVLHVLRPDRRVFHSEAVTIHVNPDSEKTPMLRT